MTRGERDGGDLEAVAPGTWNPTAAAAETAEFDPRRQAARLRALGVLLLIAGLALTAGAPVYAADARADIRSVSRAWATTTATVAEGARVVGPGNSRAGSDATLAALVDYRRRETAALRDLSRSLRSRGIADAGIADARDETAGAIEAYAELSEAIADVLDRVRGEGALGGGGGRMPPAPDRTAIGAVIVRQERRWKVAPPARIEALQIAPPDVPPADAEIHAALDEGMLAVATANGVHMFSFGAEDNHTAAGGSAATALAAVPGWVGAVVDGQAIVVAARPEQQACYLDPADHVALSPRGTLLFWRGRTGFEVDGCQPRRRFAVPEGFTMVGETVRGLVLQDASGAVHVHDGSPERLVPGPAAVLDVVDKFVAIHTPEGISIHGDSVSRLRWIFPDPPVAVALAADGRLAYAVRSGGPVTAVWVADREGGSREMLAVPGHGAIALAWSPTLRALATVTTDAVGNTRLTARDGDGQLLERWLDIGPPIALAVVP